MRGLAEDLHIIVGVHLERSDLPNVKEKPFYHEFALNLRSFRSYLSAAFFLDSSPFLVCMETAYSRIVTSHKFLKEHYLAIGLLRIFFDLAPHLYRPSIASLLCLSSRFLKLTV